MEWGFGGWEVEERTGRAIMIERTRRKARQRSPGGDMEWFLRLARMHR